MYKDVGRGALYNLCLFKVSFNALPAKIVIEDLYINQFSDKNYAKREPFVVSV